MRTACLIGAGLALVAAAPAAAADVSVRGLDTQVFDKPDIRVTVGDRVIWSFEPVLPHNAVATSANWAGFGNAAALPAPPSEFTFTAEGIYTYVCSVHATTMRGKVTVGNPPPPPLSEQPFPNDGTLAPEALERGGLDTTRPALRGVALDRSGRRVTLRFRVSERSAVTVRLERAGKRVRTKHLAAAGRASVRLGGLRAGRYRIELRARDLAGNASAARIAHVTVG